MTLFPEWQMAHAVKTSAKAKSERAAKRKSPPARYPIADAQRDTLKALSRCTFQPGSSAKRFVRDMQSATEITVGQSRFLAEVAYKYRRQLKLTNDQASGLKNRLIEITDALTTSAPLPGGNPELVEGPAGEGPEDG